MYTPPRSPFASSFEHKLPHYKPVNWQSNGTETDPFDTYPHPLGTPPPLDEQPVDPTTQPRTPRFPLIKGRTYPTPTSHARITSDLAPLARISPSPQPSFAPRTFHLSFPFIYSNSLPLYHLDASPSTAELRVRKLRARNTRAHSVPAAHLHAEQRHSSPTSTDADVLFSIFGAQLHGKAVHGPVCMVSGSTLWGVRWTKIWVGEPGSKHLLWNVSVRKGVWEDSNGRECARESEGRRLDIPEMKGRDGGDVDLLVGCWVMRLLDEGGIRDGED